MSGGAYIINLEELAGEPVALYLNKPSTSIIRYMSEVKKARESGLPVFITGLIGFEYPAGQTWTPGSPIPIVFEGANGGNFLTGIAPGYHVVATGYLTDTLLLTEIS